MTKSFAWLKSPAAAWTKLSAARFINFPALMVLGGMLLVAMMASEVLAVLPFPRPAAIEPNVRFWVDVFANYGERDFLVADRDKVWRVYQVLHLPGDGAPSRSE